MLFFTRAFVCIGLIVALAEGVNVAGLFESAGSRAKGMVDQGTSQVRRVCDADPSRCLALAAAAIAAGHRAGDLLDRPIAQPESKQRPGRLASPSRTPGAN